MLVVMTYDARNHYRELQLFRSFTTDCGKTWSEPQSFPSGLNGVTLRQGIVLSNGEWLFPLYWQEVERRFDWGCEPGLQKPDEKGDFWPFCCGVAISSDGGDTYRRYGYLKNRQSHRNLWEPTAVEVSPGHVIMLMRDSERAYLKRSDSLDYGRTWSEPINTNIPNPMTKPTLIAVEGQVLLINNFHDQSGWSNRTHLQIRVSEDALKTWRKILPIAQTDAPFFYPHAFYDKQEQILYTAYENGRQHYLAKISLSELEIHPQDQ